MRKWFHVKTASQQYYSGNPRKFQEITGNHLPTECMVWWRQSRMDHRDHEGRGLGRVWIDIRFGFQVFSFHVKPEKLKIQMIRTGRKISRILLEIKVQKITKTSKWQCSRFLESKKKGFYGKTAARCGNYGNTVWKFANFSPTIFCKNSVKLTFL